MFQSYLFPISYAFLLFPLAALLFTMPFLIVQYRRYGYVNKIRAIMLYLMLLYLMNAYFLVLLPLPASRHNAAMHGGTVQLIPLHFIQDIIKETTAVRGDYGTYWRMLQERAFLQVLFNIFLTVPFGMFLRYYFRTGWIRCLLLSFALSLSFEVTQLTGIYGIYDHAYRVFDVDDLLANTLGGMTGLVLAAWLSGLLPRIDKLDEAVDVAAKRVSYTRRGVAWIVDTLLWMTALNILLVMDIPAAFWLTTGLYFILIPALTRGRTFGKWLVRIHLVGLERPLWLGLIIRCGLLYWGMLGLNLLPGLLDLPPIPNALIMMLLLVMDLCFFIHLVRCFLNRERRIFYEAWSGTDQRITWQPVLAEQHPEEAVSGAAHTYHLTHTEKKQ
ncbi:VanZ family protein [Paenibacillus sp. JX-17]|uniref:VanZ family protein n=1 Tax=Paenibacillus lacisoli TaxID=3064525 RepID=A0ABT9CJE8_9BACL|nr:VanZ family protein [Paenibacillus sp. JX-17]MDO7907796.1 VanZ family protein [Paenibacillus sp. JX-17]